jgi:O-antigen ligase
MDNSNSKNKKGVFIFFLTIYGILFLPKFDAGNKDYFGILILGSVFLTFLFRKKFKLSISKVELLLLVNIFIVTIFDLFNLFSTEWSIISLLGIFVYNCIPLIALLVGKMFAENIESRKVDYIIFSAGLIQSVFGILQHQLLYFAEWTIGKYASLDKYYHAKYIIDDGGFERVLGTFGNPNYYGIFIAWYLLLLIFYFYPRFKSRYLVLLSIIVSAYALLVSDSRTAFIILIVVFFIFLNSIRNKLVIIYAYLLLFLIVILNYSSIETLFISRGQTASLGGRVFIWENVFNNLSSLNLRVLIGVGRDNVMNFIGEAHNYYIFEIGQHGFIGLIFYIILLVVLIITSLKCLDPNSRTFLLCTILVIIFGNMTSEAYLHSRLIIPLFLLFGFFLKKGNIEF